MYVYCNSNYTLSVHCRVDILKRSIGGSRLVALILVSLFVISSTMISQEVYLVTLFIFTASRITIFEER